MTETIENMRKFVEERKEFFMKNIFPVTDAIAKAIFDSKKLTSYAPYGEMKRVFVHNGVKVVFETSNAFGEDPDYSIAIRYKWRKVLKYQTYSMRIKIFHECEWIDKLNGLVEKIQQEDTVWKKKRILKKLKRKCKNLSKKECA